MFNLKATKIFILVLTLFFVKLSTCHAGLTLDVIWKSPKNIIVDPGKSNSVNFPALKKKKGYILCLAFKAYLLRPEPAGWNPYIALSLNKKNLNKFTLNGNKRLFCRGEMFTTTHPKDKQRSWWGLSGGKPAIMAFFGPGKGEVDKRITCKREEGYNYFLDISDLTNYLVIGADDRVESNKQNTLKFFNTLSNKYKTQLHYDDICIGYVKESVANKSRGAKLTKFPKGDTVAKLKGNGFSLDVMKSGGMVLNNKGDKYWFESYFSYPGTKQIEFSELGIAKSAGFSSWKPQIKKDGNEIKISAVNKNMSLVRTISIVDDKISIQDKITNHSQENAGTIIRNIVGIKDIPKNGTFRLSGMESDFENKCARNPTCFIIQKNGSIGIVAEDNVFRTQLELLKRSNTFLIVNKNLGIASGKSYTLKWTIYPLKSKKYFALINKIRSAWNSNYTVPGPISLFSRDIIDQKIRKTNITLFPIWFEYELPGIKLSREEFKKQFEVARKKIEAINPDMKLLGRTVTNLVTVDITKIPGGEILPARKNENRRNGKYGLKLTKAQTAVLDKTKYADSIIRDAKGNAVIDTFYVKYPYINLLVRLRKDNYRFKELRDQINYMLDVVKADGVYLDQFVPPKRFCSISYNKWDGTSVELDKKGNIKQKLYSYAIMGSAARAAIIKMVLDKGKLIMTNGQPVTKEGQSLAALRFHEMENDKFNPMDFSDKKPPILKHQTMCQLGCPMILGQRIGYAKWYGSKDQGKNLNKSIITALRNGLLYCYYAYFPKENTGYGPVNHMFPFTPVELNEGYLIGKERIITCVSRKFVWPHEEKPKCFYFDCRGFSKPADFKMTKKGSSWEVDIKLNDWNEIAVIEDNSQR